MVAVPEIKVLDLSWQLYALPERDSHHFHLQLTIQSHGLPQLLENVIFSSI